MLHTGLKKLAHLFGAECDLSWVRWAPSTADTQTLTEAHGVASVTRTGTLAQLVALANELRTDYTAHLVQGVHVAVDGDNAVATANADSEGTAITLANAVKAAYNLHIADETFHVAADATNDVETSDAEDEGTLVALSNAIKVALNAHLDESGVHAVDDTANAVATADATDSASAITLINAVKAAYNLHLVQKIHAADDETNVLSTPVATDLTTAIALVNDLRTQYTAHIADDTAHSSADETNVLTEPAATSRETAVALALDLKTALTGHYDETNVHEIDDTANTISANISVAGAYRLNLRQKGGVLFPLVGYVENDTTHYHFVDAVAVDPDAGTVDMRHLSVAFASVASGPSASDTVDELVALILQPRQATIRSGDKKRLKAFGPANAEIAYARWEPSGDAAQTLTEAHGVRGVARGGAGAWTVTLDSACKAMLVLIAYIENDTTHYHFAEVTGTDAAAGTISARHRSVAYASVASGPSASDTVDQIEVLVIKRMAT